MPIARTDDYWSAQEKKFEFLIQTTIEKDCNIYCAGDLFHKAKSSSYLEAWAIEKLKKLQKFNLKFIVIPGQHDLPNHNIELIQHSSIWVLAQSGVIDFHLVPFEDPYIFPKENIMMIHRMIHRDKPIHKDIKSTKASKLLKDNPDIRLIISGDNHQPFTEATKDNRGLINCGSMMRMTADQADYYPMFYYITIGEEVIAESIPYPIEDNVIDRSHIDMEKEIDSRMESFVNRIDTNYEIDLDFRMNLENFFKKNKVRKPVQEICWGNLE